jgi:predicted Zn-dependent protease
MPVRASRARSKDCPAGLLGRQVDLLILRSNAQADLGKAADAVRSLDESRALDPESVAVRLALVNVLLRTGDKTRATRLLDETIKLAPSNSAVWNLRASLSHLGGNLPAALADYAKAIALDSRNVDALVAQAGILLDLGRLAEANATLANLQQVAPNEPRAVYLQAVAAGRVNDDDAVRAKLTNVIAMLDPVSKEVLSQRPQLLLWAACRTMARGTARKPLSILSST